MAPPLLLPQALALTLTLTLLSASLPFLLSSSLPATGRGVSHLLRIGTVQQNKTYTPYGIEVEGDANAGASLALTQEGLDYVNYDVATPLLTKTLNNLNIPDVNTKTHGVQITLNNIHTSDFGCDKCVSLGISSGQLHVGLTKFSLRVEADFHYKWHFVKDHGHCRVDIGGNAVGYDLVLGEAAGHPTVTATNVQSSFGKFKLHCGGISGTIISIISGLFQKTIIKSLQKELQKELETLAQQANAALVKVPLDFPITSYAEIRYDLMEAPLIKNNSLQVGVIGLVTPQEQPTLPIPYPVPPAFPYYDASVSSYIQLCLSAYSLNSLAYTFFIGGYEKAVIPAQDIPSSFPLQLTTHSIGKLVAPDIEKTYPNKTMQIAFSVSDKPWVNVTEKGILVTVPSFFDFQVLTGEGEGEGKKEGKEGSATAASAFVLFCPAAMGATASISKNEVISANLTLLQCDLSLKNSSVGTVRAQAVGTLVNFALSNVVIPFVNAYLQKGIPIPGTDFLQLTDTSLSLKEGYLAISTKFTVKVNTKRELGLKKGEGERAGLRASASRTVKRAGVRKMIA